MYKYKIFTYIIICFFCTSIIRGQEKSLEKSIHQLKQKINATEKTEKLKLLDSLYKLTYEKREFKYDSILNVYIDFAFEIDSTHLALKRTSDLIFYYANRAWTPKKGVEVFDAFQKKDNLTQDYKLLAQLYRNGGDSYYFSGKIRESESLYEKAETYALKNNDSIAYALARAYKSAVFSKRGDYSIASKLLKETASIFQKKKDTNNLLFVRAELATLYSKIGFLEDSKKERDEIIAIAKHMHKTPSLVSESHQSLVANLYNAALEQNIAGNQKQRIIYLTEAYQHVTEPDYKNGIKSAVFYGLLNAYSETDSLSKAKIFFNKIQSTYALKKTIPYESIYRTGLANYYIATKDYNKALKESQWVLKYHENTGDTWGIYHMNQRLAIIYKALNNIEESYKHYIDFVTLRDSINSVKKGQALSYYQTQYETEKRDFKISEQKTEITVLDQQNKIKNQWLLFGGLGLLFGFAIIYLFRSRNFTRKEKKNQELFSQELIKNQEDQRTQVARDLHDSVGQKLMLLTKQVNVFKNKNIDDLAKNTLKELREISRGLYPATFEQIGITASIKNMIKEIDTNTNLFFMLEIDNIDESLSNQNALHLYRIIQKVLNNIVKHADAKSVLISIVNKDSFIITEIKDNGIGFEFTEKLNSNSSLGMKTLFERAKIIKSKLLVNSKKDKGTTMQLITPVL